MDNTKCQILQSRPTGFPPKGCAQVSRRRGAQGTSSKRELAPGTPFCHLGPTASWEARRNAKVRETHQALERTEAKHQAGTIGCGSPLISVHSTTGLGRPSRWEPLGRPPKPLSSPARADSWGWGMRGPSPPIGSHVPEMEKEPRKPEACTDRPDMTAEQTHTTQTPIPPPAAPGNPSPNDPPPMDPP